MALGILIGITVGAILMDMIHMMKECSLRKVWAPKGDLSFPDTGAQILAARLKRGGSEQYDVEEEREIVSRQFHLSADWEK